MRPTTFTPICIAFAAMLSGAATAAPSTMYRWVDEHGSVSYSNHPPPDTARDVTVIDDATNTISSSEKRTREIIEIERQSNAPREPEPSSAVAIDPASAASSDTVARSAVAPTQPEAVRDPCLRSSDPKCYERNRAAYVPYLGYTTSGASLVAVGSTSSAGAGGTLGGGAPGHVKLTAPSPSAYALPPGSDTGAPLPPLRRTKR